MSEFSKSAEPDESVSIAAILLLKARRLLSGETVPRDRINAANKDTITPAWCKVMEGHAQDERGNYVEPWDESACKWSLIGALARYGMRLIPLSPVPGLRDESQFNAAWKYLFMAALVQSSATSTPSGINNNGWEATEKLIDFAIRLAENRAELLITLAIEPESELGREMAAKAKAAGTPKGKTN